MINKEHVGKRLCALRLKAGLSQSALAERMGVTPQAVSKWECGTALADVEMLLDLSHLYHVTINDILEDRDLLLELTGQATPADGIACFTYGKVTDEFSQWDSHIRREGWIKQNWQTAQEHPDPIRARTGQRIASLGGVILETGAGPGGGFMPYILRHDPDATVIINDLSPTVVSEWQRLLSRELTSPNLYFAAFDFTCMPLKDNCIDVISDGGGIGNTIGSRAAALRECFRVLRPGGTLITSTGFVTRETLSSLPREAQRILQAKRPDVLDSLYEEAVLAGFTHIESEICGGWDTDDDESGIADLARSLGVNLHFTSYIRTCVKP